MHEKCPKTNNQHGQYETVVYISLMCYGRSEKALFNDNFLFLIISELGNPFTQFYQPLYLPVCILGSHRGWTENRRIDKTVGRRNGETRRGGRIFW